MPFDPRQKTSDYLRSKSGFLANAFDYVSPPDKEGDILTGDAMGPRMSGNYSRMLQAQRKLGGLFTIEEQMQHVKVQEKWMQQYLENEQWKRKLWEAKDKATQLAVKMGIL